MADLKQSRVQFQQRAEHNRPAGDTRLRKVGVRLLVAGFMLSWLQTATAQPDPSGLQQRRADLEVQKLELEVAKLEEEQVGWDRWLTGFLGLLAGVVGTATSVWVARRARAGAMDQATHEKRLESYPRLVQATSPLALYFPGDDPLGRASIGPDECRAMGREMSKWYFEDGGLLLSVEARKAYFKLARALTRASFAQTLNVPAFPSDACSISDAEIAKYRCKLAKQLKRDDVEKWEFGSSPSEPEGPSPSPAWKFKDYVFLQGLSSDLRTKLSKDLRSRRRPS